MLWEDRDDGPVVQAAQAYKTVTMAGIPSCRPLRPYTTESSQDSYTTALHFLYDGVPIVQALFFPFFFLLICYY